jgi:predicted nucleic-acid-binding Zn-ribbon protein
MTKLKSKSRCAKCGKMESESIDLEDTGDFKCLDCSIAAYLNI